MDSAQELLLASTANLLRFAKRRGDSVEEQASDALSHTLGVDHALSRRQLTFGTARDYLRGGGGILRHWLKNAMPGMRQESSRLPYLRTILEFLDCFRDRYVMGYWIPRPLGSQHCCATRGLEAHDFVTCPLRPIPRHNERRWTACGADRPFFPDLKGIGFRQSSGTASSRLDVAKVGIVRRGVDRLTPPRGFCVYQEMIAATPPVHLLQGDRSDPTYHASAVSRLNGKSVVDFLDHYAIVLVALNRPIYRMGRWIEPEVDEFALDFAVGDRICTNFTLGYAKFGDWARMTVGIHESVTRAAMGI